MSTQQDDHTIEAHGTFTQPTDVAEPESPTEPDQPGDEEPAGQDEEEPGKGEE
jgi:hypothetical protein